MSWHDLALAQESCGGHGTFSPLLTANVNFKYNGDLENGHFTL